MKISQLIAALEQVYGDQGDIDTGPPYGTLNKQIEAMEDILRKAGDIEIGEPLKEKRA
jgi:hypothetical protein